MNDNSNTAKDLTAMVFSFLSFKVKMIILGIIIGLFLIILIPVMALATTGNVDDEESVSSSTNTNINSEFVSSDKLYQYTNAKFSMPFETWNSSQDVVTSKFSPSRTITVNGVVQTRPHTGIDLVVKSIGSPRICAVMDGEVVSSKVGSSGYGNYVVIKHILKDDVKGDLTIYTLYAHMRAGSLMVGEGNKVVKGQVLGIMGSTGNSTGPHLHFEIRVGSNESKNAVDPYNYLFGE